MKKYDLTLIKDRFRYLRDQLDLNQAEFASFFGKTQARVSAIETGKTKPTQSWIKTAELIFGVNRSWLISGEGEFGNISFPYEEGLAKHSAPSQQRTAWQAEKAHSDKSLTIKKVNDQDPRIDMALQVLQSDTHYAESLEKNIHSFYSAVKKEKDLEDKLQEQDRQLDNQGRRITELEDFIHKILMRTDKNPVNFHQAGGSFSTAARKRKRPK